jgi:hypothetical protein
MLAVKAVQEQGIPIPSKVWINEGIVMITEGDE